MRISDDWMALADERILEYLQEEGPSNPKKIADDSRVHFNRQYIGRRLRGPLSDHGFVKNTARGVYAITDDGQAYLAGDLDASNLERED